jgi:hypothetical protein
MIPHAPLTLAGSVGALLVAVVSTSIGAIPMLPSCLCCRNPPHFLPTGLPAVDVTTVTAPVDQEYLPPGLALSRSKFQWSSARPKNATTSFHPGPDRRYRVGVRRLLALPTRRLGALTPGLLSFYSRRCTPDSPRNAHNASFSPVCQPPGRPGRPHPGTLRVSLSPAVAPSRYRRFSGHRRHWIFRATVTEDCRIEVWSQGLPASCDGLRFLGRFRDVVAVVAVGPCGASQRNPVSTLSGGWLHKSTALR